MNVAMFITDRDKDSAILRGCRDKEGPAKSKAERKGKKSCKGCWASLVGKNKIDLVSRCWRSGWS
jgi:hypothetical protein